MPQAESAESLAEALCLQPRNKTPDGPAKSPSPVGLLGIEAPSSVSFTVMRTKSFDCLDN